MLPQCAAAVLARDEGPEKQRKQHGMPAWPNLKAILLEGPEEAVQDFDAEPVETDESLQLSLIKASTWEAQAPYFSCIVYVFANGRMIVRPQDASTKKYIYF